MHNIPEGAENHPAAPWSDEDGKECPRCQAEMEERKNAAGWIWNECHECGHKDTLVEGY